MRRTLFSVQLVLAALLSVAASVPTLEEMAGDWIDLTVPASPHVSASFLDLPVIANFHGSAGSAPGGSWPSSGSHEGGVRPVDLFAVNSLEIPPFAGCGNSASKGTPQGCGRLTVNGRAAVATGTRYRADEVRRRNDAVTADGLAISSSMRMLFEGPGVMWKINVSRALYASHEATPIDLEFEIPAMVSEYAHLSWVLPLPSDPADFTYTATRQAGSDGMVGVLSVGKEKLRTPAIRPAAAHFGFVGGPQPEIILGAGNMTIPRALFRGLEVAPGQNRLLRILLSVGTNATASTALAKTVGGTVATFDNTWDASHERWEARWQSAFDEKGTFFSGSAPTLDLDGADRPESAAAEVTRVYYASVLSVVSQLRTNLPLMHSKVFPTSQGNNEGLREGGVMIGGAVTYFWDEALSSTLLSLLEPAGRRPTFQAWFTSDLRGKRHNWFDLDCAPNPVGSVYGPCNFSGVPPPAPAGKTVYPYNIWSYGVALFNHLRANNDTAFLEERAAKSNLTVDEALADIALDWQGTVINGTRLADYGTNLDGFSPTYKHVMPGMQGNNIWMVRQLAHLRELQGEVAVAKLLRDEASAMAAETVQTMLGGSDDGTRAWWNVIWPVGVNGTLQANEMRHVVDFFSVAFGMCGVKGLPSDLDASQRARLSNFFHEELKTSDWIRATSPLCNCSKHFNPLVVINAAGPDLIGVGGEVAANASRSWPGLVTCNAAREDHGTTGAYTAWPALAAEALCYLDGNCSAAFKVMASFEPTTRQGAFGQANAVPQLQTPPYTPYNDEPAFKPNDRRYLNMAVGAFADAVVRGFFGYHPPPIWPASPSEAALNATLITTDQSRGFTGRLRHLRTPFGLATISSSPTGLAIELEAE